MFRVKEEVIKDRFSVPKSGTFPAELNNLLQEHKNLFSGQGSGIKGFIGSLKLKEGAKPVFVKDRPVPYSLIEKVEEEYDQLVESDILYPVSSSKWASPRVCGDYKAINECIEDDMYKLPKVQDMFAMLSQDGANPDIFSVIDFASVVLSTNYVWMKSQLSFSPSTLEKVYSNPSYYSKFIKDFSSKLHHCISFSVTGLSGFGPKNVKPFLNGIKKFFRVSRFWFIMTPKNFSF